MDPNKGFFIFTQNRVSMQPNRLSNLIPNHLLHFQYFGRLLAKSFLDGFTPSIDLTCSFIKHIVGKYLQNWMLKSEDLSTKIKTSYFLKNYKENKQFFQISKKQIQNSRGIFNGCWRMMFQIWNRISPIHIMNQEKLSP